MLPFQSGNGRNGDGFSDPGGNIFGSLVPIATGYIVKWTGSFDLAFYLAGFLLLVAAVVCFTMTRKPLSFQENAA
jgi:cyanate permease